MWLGGGDIYCKKHTGIQGSNEKILAKSLFPFSQLSGGKSHNKSLLECS